MDGIERKEFGLTVLLILTTVGGELRVSNSSVLPSGSVACPLSASSACCVARDLFFNC